ncbi:MAG: alpha/beta hydrolase [Hydrogenophaga sp.]|uniref:alpha/beta hydrolase n=1 Tax=Hydrogenophaga sp. TaxID=1904254 RepID=UPI0027217248|nr:alpha/beta hydrolase [Hydrogenophaga sp.]MDO9481004.1 alpha/beta hydrolase [Hydrogenophaga sp.]MDP3345988.1 alpha/beta hydrolase [Hydrogenophaga sp.]MDP3809286.1 alpha/beta hydrolase [Hydrogenophaga sp.]MDP3923255.1 alpha/beta hydrolase [Hydrogenophaga sp.]
MTVTTTLPSAPMDPGLAGFLAHAAEQGNPPLESLPPEIGRQIYRDLAAGLGLPPPVVATEDRQIAGPGGPLKLRIYHPDAPGTLPALFYVHGGGFVIGDLETHDTVCRTLCHNVGAVVVAVDYRLAPEHPFPAAVDDVVCVLQWLAAHAPAMRVDPSRIALAGDSAGGQLATVACLRTAGTIAPRALGLIYPVAQHHSEPSASMAENGEGKFLTLGVMQWFLDSYLGGRSELKRHPDFALLSAPTLATLPATWVATMGHDPLRDEGHALAQRIEQSGVVTEHRHYPGAIHACIHFTAVSPVGSQVMADLCAWLRDRLANPGTGH